MSDFLSHVVDNKQNLSNHSRTANKKAKKDSETDPFSLQFNDYLQADSNKNSRPEERKRLVLSGGKDKRVEQKEKKDTQIERATDPDRDRNRNGSPIKTNRSDLHANTFGLNKNSHDLIPDIGTSSKKTALSANQKSHQKDLERQKKNLAETHQTGLHKNKSDAVPVVETSLNEASMGTNLIGPSKKKGVVAFKEDGKNDIKADIGRSIEPKKAYSRQSATAKLGSDGALEHSSRSDEAKRSPLLSSDGQEESRKTDREISQKLSVNNPDKADHEPEIKNSGAAQDKSQRTDQAEKAESARFEQHETKEPKTAQPHSLRHIGGVHAKDAKSVSPKSSAKTDKPLSLHAADNTEARKGEKAPVAQSGSDSFAHHQMQTEEAQRAENILPGTVDVSSEGYSEGDGELQNATQEEGSLKSFEEPKEDLPSSQAKSYKVDFKLQDVSISAKIRNQTLSLLVNLDSNAFVHEGLREEIRAILHENGFKSYRLTIKEKTKKTYLETSEKAIPAQREKNQIDVKA